MAHYDMTGDHFASKGGGAYDFYHEATKSARATGDDVMGKAFTDLQIWGAPEQCLEKIQGIQDIIGAMNMNVSFSYAGMPYDCAKKSMTLFAEEVVPVVQQWDTENHKVV